MTMDQAAQMLELLADVVLWLKGCVLGLGVLFGMLTMFLIVLAKNQGTPM